MNAAVAIAVRFTNCFPAVHKTFKFVGYGIGAAARDSLFSFDFSLTTAAAPHTDVCGAAALYCLSGLSGGALHPVQQVGIDAGAVGFVQGFVSRAGI